MDTEFIRVSTYWPQLALIQFIVDAEGYFIDPLSLKNFPSFIKILEDPEIPKVFHSCSQDMEIFIHHLKASPRTLFDTQVAAQFCGFGPSVSYNTLVFHYCRVSLDKSLQLTPWLERPLSQKQLLYAYNDVRYLKEVYGHLVRDLKTKGYEAFAWEEMEHLESPFFYQVDPEKVWKRIQTKKNSPRFLGKLKVLARLRETLAKQMNKPRRHVLKDDVLIHMALTSPLSLDDLYKSPGYPSFLRKASVGYLFLQGLQEAEGLPDEALPRSLPKMSLSEEQKNTLAQYKNLLHEVSVKTGIDPSLIAPSKNLEMLVRSPEKYNKILEGWRYTLFGQFCGAVSDSPSVGITLGD